MYHVHPHGRSSEHLVVIECSGAECVGGLSGGTKRTLMLRRKAILAMSLLAALGCANKANMPKVVTPERPIPAKGIRLAVLPVESDGFPEVAEWVSNLLADVRVSGVDEYFKTRVALAVV